MRMHFRTKIKERKKWENIILFHMLNSGYRLWEPLKQAKVTLIRYSSVEPDQDNLTFSFKLILDALQRTGVLLNDNRKCLGEVIYRWEKVKRGEGAVEIRVDEA